MEIKAKFWIENKGEVVLGGGKTALLLTLDRLGSIQRAADEFGMSYRHAWGAIEKVEQRAGFKIVDQYCPNVNRIKSTGCEMGSRILRVE